MRLSIKYKEVDWWFWAIIGLALGLGLVGYDWAYMVALAVSVANLVYRAARDRSLVTFPVQVREVWLGLVSLAMLVNMTWLYFLLFAGMVLVVFFDRCGIARVLVMMPWNNGIGLKS